MSRSGYVDYTDDPFASGRWRAAVRRAVRGKRGQSLLRDLVAALDAMEDKRLYPGSFATAEGEFCALGALGAARGTKMDDLVHDDECDTDLVGERFGIATSMAAEIMYMNDEHVTDDWKTVTVEICGPMRPHFPDYGKHTRRILVPNSDAPIERWRGMRAWALANIRSEADHAK